MQLFGWTGTSAMLKRTVWKATIKQPIHRYVRGCCGHAIISQRPDLTVYLSITNLRPEGLIHLLQTSYNSLSFIEISSFKITGDNQVADVLMTQPHPQPKDMRV